MSALPGGHYDTSSLAKANINTFLDLYCVRKVLAALASCHGKTYENLSRRSDGI